jgi:glucose/arabinose dehydrogenase
VSILLKLYSSPCSQDFLKGEVFADGLRNEVALDFAMDGTLWGVGNSAEFLFRADLGGDIHNNNPGEEVHRFDRPGLLFGYPYCWREFDMVLGKGRGTAWAWPDPLGDKLSKSVSDEQCRSDEYAEPKLILQSHSAPLGLTFYRYSATRPAQCNGVTPFPPEMNGFAFVAYHGSFNRVVPTGYKVVYFALTKDGTGVEGGIGGTPQDLLVHEGLTAQWSDGFRPVDLSFDACGRLLVTSDGSKTLAGNFEGDKIVRIEATQNSLPPAPVPSPQTIGNGLFLAFFAGLWRRIQKWLGLFG